MVLVGIFTVAGPLNWFLVSMIHHPEWLARCQKEIDEICNERMPTLNDSPNLPVLRACIKKTVRGKPNVPQVRNDRICKHLNEILTTLTVVAHEAEADDFYRGYFIPKGTHILPLDW